MRVVAQSMRGIYTIITYLISPPYCATCRRFLLSRTVFCQSCIKKIRPIISHRLALSSTTDLIVHAIADYKEPLKSLILAKRWSNIVAARQLGELMWDMTIIKNIEFDYIVPIPLHWSRYAQRGFNQAEEMAQIIAQSSGKPVMHLVKRSRSTIFQSKLSSIERARNVIEAFELNTPLFGKDRFKAVHQGKKILLVDDLMTTGATLISVAKVLRSLQSNTIVAVVACRVV